MLPVNNEREIAMRIVWKDTRKEPKPVRYRKCTITGYGSGWVTSLPGDTNIYAARTDAMNYIDKVLGGHSKMGEVNRKNGRIKVIGNINQAM